MCIIDYKLFKIKVLYLSKKFIYINWYLLLNITFIGLATSGK